MSHFESFLSQWLVFSHRNRLFSIQKHRLCSVKSIFWLILSQKAQTFLCKIDILTHFGPKVQTLLWNSWFLTPKSDIRKFDAGVARKKSRALLRAIWSTGEVSKPRLLNLFYVFSIFLAKNYGHSLWYVRSAKVENHFSTYFSIFRQKYMGFSLGFGLRFGV